MDRNYKEWLLNMQQKIDETAIEVEQNAKRGKEINQHITNMIGIVNQMLKILEHYEKEVPASNLRGPRRGNLDQRTVNEQNV